MWRKAPRRKPLAKLFLEISYFSLLFSPIRFTFCLSFLFPPYICHSALQIPSLCLSLICHNKYDQFQSCFEKPPSAPQKALSTHTHTCALSRTYAKSISLFVKPYLLLFLFYHNRNFVPHNSYSLSSLPEAYLDFQSSFFAFVCPQILLSFFVRTASLSFCFFFCDPSTFQRFPSVL